ncbi:hypothetical protein C7S17_7492 [Burkholderia thailandensis]|nr:hypothetical protein [Burkholderia thailandensis]
MKRDAISNRRGGGERGGEPMAVAPRIGAIEVRTARCAARMTRAVRDAV